MLWVGRVPEGVPSSLTKSMVTSQFCEASRHCTVITEKPCQTPPLFTHWVQRRSTEGTYTLALPAVKALNAAVYSRQWLVATKAILGGLAPVDMTFTAPLHWHCRLVAGLLHSFCQNVVVVKSGTPALDVFMLYVLDPNRGN